MKILLLENVPGLGQKGEIRDVKDGYAQNFLIAKKKALHATSDVVKKFEADQRRLAEEERHKIAQKQAVIASLQGLVLQILKPVGKNDALFGAITKDDIVRALEEKKIFIDKKCLEIPSAIKTTGDYEIDVRLGSGVSGALKISVREQK